MFVSWALLGPWSPRTSFGNIRDWTEFAVTVHFGPDYELKIHFFLHFKHHFSRTMCDKLQRLSFTLYEEGKYWDWTS